MNKLFTLFLFFSITISYAQNEYYSSPVKIPILLSGNFAELRSNHFHSGIDIKTQGTIGHHVFAIESGTTVYQINGSEDLTIGQWHHITGVRNLHQFLD